MSIIYRSQDNCFPYAEVSLETALGRLQVCPFVDCRCNLYVEMFKHSLYYVIFKLGIVFAVFINFILQIMLRHYKGSFYVGFLMPFIALFIHGVLYKPWIR